MIRDGDPHDYGFLRGIGGFWSSLCALSQASGAHGGVDGGTKQMVYVIGTSFTLELALKAAYEETLGRVATWIRGPDHAATDVISARQAADYAAFLRQALGIAGISAVTPPNCKARATASATGNGPPRSDWNTAPRRPTPKRSRPPSPMSAPMRCG